MSAAVPLPAEQIERAVLLARRWQERAAALQTPAERRQQAELDRLLHAPEEKATLIQITDQAFRTQSPRRTVDQFTHILEVQGVPSFFSPVERALLRGFQAFGSLLPSVSAPLVKSHLRRETDNVVLPAERTLLSQHLRERQTAGLRMNVNLLGESLLGEGEARARAVAYLEALQLPELEVLSVKISTLYSQISALDRETTLRVLCERLEPLFREAHRLPFARPDGTVVSKFIYLDMEEYRDMTLTAETFMRTLDRPGLEQVHAGLALQAYLPDSILVQRQLTAWAQDRVDRSGAPMTLRLVKGANLEMERVEASLRGWPQAPFQTKAETDASYVRMLREGLQPENLRAVRLGIASHNLFDLALGHVLAEASGAGDRVQFEMLEGMANHQRRALAEAGAPLLLYAPACRREDFLHAIGYLVRRLDENTGPDNFLRHTFRLQPGSEEWEMLEAQFRASCQAQVETRPRRTQDRRRPAPAPLPHAEFDNEPDTDFALPHHAEWAREIIARREPRHSERAPEIPLVIDGAEVIRDRPWLTSPDPSRPHLVTLRYAAAEAAEVERALACAQEDAEGWCSRPPAERSSILAAVAQEIRLARADLIGAAMANAGKTVPESDPEVSEAVDFVEYYRRSAEEFCALPGAEARPIGVTVVVPPWNFPIAIPCGGIAAALAAGNTVILKPASPAVLVAWELCQCFWRGGISRRVLQFLPCAGAEPATRLVTDPSVKAVILTGGTATALHLLKQRPEMPLSAETGGKNATVVTALSDREQAIKHVIHSAFSHSGQKCSATSLLLLEAEVYDDPHFQAQLVDAAASLAVGSAWDLGTRVGPLIRPPGGDLARGLTTLEPGERWVLPPRQVGENSHLWSPGIKYGVQPGSYTHTTEFFGPVLGVMRFEGLEQAISLVNSTGYGLTSGLQSLDDREQALWRDGIRAGNLYINKPTVGAIVRRQPFGGLAKSAIGPALKAGGPNYVAQFMTFRDLPSAAELPPAVLNEELAKILIAVPRQEPHWPPEELAAIHRAIVSYHGAWAQEFGRQHDESRLLGEDNFRRCLPFSVITVRAHESDTLFELLARLAAARILGCRVRLSVPPLLHTLPVRLLHALVEGWDGPVTYVLERDEDLAARLRAGKDERLRFAAPHRVPPLLRRVAAECGAYLADRPISSQGRVELLWYLREQSLSHAYHRYGNLSGRAAEPRREPA